MNYSIILHGGTAMEPSIDEVSKQNALKEILDRTKLFLSTGGSALDAVTQAVMGLEECGLFEAGAGSEPQRDNIVRYDAAIMSSEEQAGAVLSVSGIQSPISAARIVHDQIQHTTLTGVAGEKVLKELGAISQPLLPTPTIPISECVRAYREEGGKMFGTVGAVALDVRGNLVAGTSTGGYKTALPGRTGDSGVVGVGTYATLRCAISCTGDGDRIVLAGLGAALDAYLECNIPLEKAVKMALNRLERVNARGGFIVLIPDGTAYVGSNVPVMRTVCSRRITECIL